MNKDNCLVLFRGTREMYRFQIEQIVYIQTISNEDWCRVYLAEPLRDLDNPIEIPLRLIQLFEEIKLQSDGNNNFVRCGRSSIINLSYIRKIDTLMRTIHLSDGINYYRLDVSHEACKGIMTLMRQALKS